MKKLLISITVAFLTTLLTAVTTILRRKARRYSTLEIPWIQEEHNK